MGGLRRSGRIEAALAALADAQYGVVARRQLLVLGVSSRAVEARLADRRLIRLHRGVYAVGHRRLSRHGFWMAAVLAVGPQAALSHRDAAALHGLRSPHEGRSDVTTTSQAKSTRAIRVHQTVALTSLDVTTLDGIPVTTVSRTLLDLAEVLPQHQLAAALSEAERQNVLDVHAIEAALRRTWGRRGRGHANLNKALRKIVEIDGWDYHKTRRAFERDRRKRTQLRVKGYEVTELTHHQLTKEPLWVAHQLRRLLDAEAP